MNQLTSRYQPRRRDIRSPGRHDTSTVPERVVDCRELAAILGMRQLGDEHPRTALGVADTKPDDESCGDEHADRGADGLQNDAEED